MNYYFEIKYPESSSNESSDSAQNFQQSPVKTHDSPNKKEKS